MDHRPVMESEIVEAFRVVSSRSPRKQLSYLDLTVGFGGHFRRLVGELPISRALAVDRDPQALCFVKSEFEPPAGLIVDWRLGNFAQVLSDLNQRFDLVLIDLGVSSPQLDQPERGFSFFHDGPLDMRMNPESGPTAAAILADSSGEVLEEVFRNYGEVSRPRLVVSRILAARREAPLTTTRQLADLIEKAEGWHKKGHHPATKYFLALRLFVNQELESVIKALGFLPGHLEPGGRLAIMTFHSLEDRLVKTAFRSWSGGQRVNRRALKPSLSEIQENPRARSAILRIWERNPEE